MKPGAATAPRLGVQRQFETNRFAKSSQAQAYEEALPIVERRGTRAAMMALMDVGLQETGQVIPKGVAA
jgi:hypothetical protein